jgi:thiol-disulfide isomerase/thioredoxin
MKRILIFILIILTGCNDSKTDLKTENFESKKVLDTTSGKALISGKTDDSMAFKFFNIIEYYPMGTRNHIDDIKFKDSLLIIELDSISNPQFFRIFASSNKDAVYNAKILIDKNDTVTFEIKDYEINFNGKKAKEYNYYTNLIKATPNYAYNPYNGNISDYKRRVDSIYKLKSDFFNTYIKDNNIKSSEFISRVKNDLKFQHLQELINPRTKKSGKSYFIDPDGLIPIIQNEHKSESFFKMNDYLDNVTLNELKNESLINNQFFWNSFSSLIRYYFEDSDYPIYSKEKFLAEKDFIEENFDGEIERYGLLRLISNYHRMGFGRSKNDILFFLDYIDNNKSLYIDTPYLETIEKIKGDLKSYQFELSDSSLETKLISKHGDTTTLKEIFGRSSKRIKVIDFWASWCAPCINEITKAKSFKDRLSVENNVEWIYLSIDENTDEWIKKSEELSDYLNVRNQYIIHNGKKSALVRSLKANIIPRYVILNNENLVVLNNSPCPSDSIVFEKIIDKIQLKN